MPSATITPFHAWRSRGAISMTCSSDWRVCAGRMSWPTQAGRTACHSATPRELVAYWRDEYDWRAEEARLNAHPSSRPTSTGSRPLPPRALARARCAAARPPPRLAGIGRRVPRPDRPADGPRAHGGNPATPSTSWSRRFPASAFSGPTRSPAGTEARARAWAQLMARLGYERYGAHGNDIGAQIAGDRHDPERWSACTSRSCSRSRPAIWPSATT